MNCPICHAEMVLDYKIKIENGILFNLVTIKKKNDQKKVKAAFPDAVVIAGNVATAAATEDAVSVRLRSIRDGLFRPEATNHWSKKRR